MDTDRCVKILSGCECLRTEPCTLLLDFPKVPFDLSAREFEVYLREHAEQICKPRQPPVGSRAAGTT